MASTSPEIKAVIFDFAGVIGVDGYWAWLRDNIADLNAEERFFHDISYQVDRAELTELQFLDRIHGKCGIPIDQIRDEIIGRLKIDQGVVGIIKNLKPAYKTALLSNFIFEWLDRILIENDLYRLFDQAVISSAHAMAKPEPEIFQKTAGLLGLKPAETVFIDDRAVNIEAAERLGMRGLLFTSAEGLRADLASLDITV